MRIILRGKTDNHIVLQILKNQKNNFFSLANL